MKKQSVYVFIMGIIMFAAGCGKNNPAGPGPVVSNTPEMTKTVTQTPTPTNTPFFSPTVTPTNAPTVAIANAVDYNTVSWWTVGSPGALWFGNTVYYWPFGDTDAAQSGTLGDSDSSYMETSIAGPGDLSWYVMTDTAAGDELRVYVDTVYTGLSASGLGLGINFWSQQSVHLSAGSHTIRWEYSKDASGSAGADAVWVDRVEFAADTPAETGTVTPTSTPEDTGTSTFTRTVTETSTITLTNTDSPTFTVTSTATVTLTVTDSPTGTPTPTATLSSTNTPYVMEFQYGSLPSATYNGTRDVRTNSGWANYSFGGCNTLVTNTTNRSMIYFDVSLIPAGSTVVSAEIIFTGYGGALIDMRAYEMSRSWSEDGVCMGAASGATWNSYGGGLWTVPGGDYGGPQVGSGMIAASGQSTLTLVNNVAQSWIDNPASNNGLMLLNWTGGGTYVELFSREEGTVSARPKLRIKYYTAGAPVSTNTVNTTPTHTPSVTATFTSTIIPTSTATATADTQMLFTSNRDGNNEIYIMNADGSAQTRLTTSPADDAMPSWSPGRGSIVFASSRDGNTEIYVMDRNGSGQTRITYDNSWDGYPSWSPDGNKIVFTSNRDGYFEVYAMNSDGSGQVKLTANASQCNFPKWSPDGSKIIFQMMVGGVQSDIMMMDADGGNQVNLTNNSGQDNYPNWSPDGTKITFGSNRGGDYEIYTMDPNGANVTNITNYPSATDNSPSFSPDGLMLSFYSTRTGDTEIFTMNSNGSGQVNISNNAASDAYNNWSGHGGIFAGSTTTPYPSATNTATCTATQTATNTPPPGVAGTITTLTNSSANFYVWAYDTSYNMAAFAGGAFTGGTTAAYSMNLAPGNYYIQAVVYEAGPVIPGTGYPLVGDRIGVYGATWPAWPAAPLTITSGITTANITAVVQGTTNFGGTVSLSGSPSFVSKDVWVECSGNTFISSSVPVAGFVTANLSRSGSFGYGMILLHPGPVYIRGAVDMSGDGYLGDREGTASLETGDFFGYYGGAVPPPVDNYPGSTVNITDLSILNSYSFTIYPKP